MISRLASNMEETLAKNKRNANRIPETDFFSGAGDGDEEFDGELWKTLSIGFQRVQSVLDHNRALMKQVNENHQSKIPDNLAKNVALIREINENISKVVSIYSDISVNFTTMIRQRKTMSKNCNNNVNCSNANGGNKFTDAAVK